MPPAGPLTRRRLSVWPPLPPAVYARRTLRAPPFPLEEPGCRIVAWARHAVFHGVRSLGLSAGEEVLMPAYHHGSEVEALTRAGLGCRFYEAHAGLEPAEEELERALGPSVRALYLIHYLGFPQDAPRWRRWCDARGLLLIEDAAQAWLARREGRPVGSDGHLAFFCLYKTIGLPEGAAMLTTPPPAARGLDPRLGWEELARRHGTWLAGRSPLVHRLAVPFQRSSRDYDPDQDFDLRDPAGSPWRSTPFLLARLADPEVAAARRAHYELLLEALGEHVPSPFARLPAGASPFMLPVTAARAPDLLERLDRHGVKGLWLWSQPHRLLDADRFRGAAERRRATVGLPVHQELEPRDLRQIVAAAAPSLPPRAIRVEPLEDLDTVREEWDALAEAGGNIFATWEWASTWWRHFGEDRPLLLRGVRRGRSLVAILPLYLARAGRVAVARLLGHGPGDQLGPVCAPADRPAAAWALLRTLARDPRRPDLFVGEQMPAHERWAATLGGRVLREEASPVIRADGGFEGYLAARSANLRGQLRRRERRLARAHELRYRQVTEPEELPDALDTLIALHAARWGEGAGAFAGARAAFHREFAAQALARGWLRLWILEVDGHPAAAWYGFRYRGAESYYQSGRDPRFAELSPGSVLLTHTIREALEDGVDEYRLLRGDEAYKRRLATSDPGLQTVAVARGPAGRAALAAARGVAELPPPARRVIVSLAG